MKVTVNLQPLHDLQAAIDADLQGGDGPIGQAFVLWGHRVCAFLQERYATNSMGGGDWPPLKDRTMMGRRSPTGGTRGKRVTALKKQAIKATALYHKTGSDKHLEKLTSIRTKIVNLKAGKSENGKKIGAAILRDTGTLFNALDPDTESPGGIKTRIPFGITVGYGGQAGHPKSTATIADIALWHQAGMGNLPVREIIVEPPDTVVAAMRVDMLKALDNLSKTTGNQ